MAFSEKYRTVLVPFVKEYETAANEKARKAVLKNAAKAVRESRDVLEDRESHLPKDLPAAISRYIKGSTKKKEGAKEADEDPKPKKLKSVYSLRDVIKQNHRDRVEAEIPFKPTDKEYIGSYQKAVTTVLENMDDEDLEDAENLRDLWNEQGAPSEVQYKRAKTKLPKDIRKKVEEWKFSSGALVMCLVAYSNGENIDTFHVESSPLAGNSFTNSCTEWRDGTYENFKEWAVKQFGGKESDSDDETEVPVHMQKAKDIVFEKNGKGHFILPPRHGYKTNRQRQRVIRGYVGAVYREFTGNRRAAFPYILASKDDQTIFSPDCVPKDFQLSDPDHLTTSEIDALYTHLAQRQRKGLSPFIVLNASPLHRTAVKKSSKAKGKEKVKYVDVHTEDEDVKSERGGEEGDETGDDDEEESEGGDGEKEEADEEEKEEEDEEEKEDDYEEEKEGEKEGKDGDGISPALKIGPPRRKNPPSSTKIEDHSSPVAGPSKLVPPKTKKDPKPQDVASRKPLVSIPKAGPEAPKQKGKPNRVGTKKKNLNPVEVLDNTDRPTEGPNTRRKRKLEDEVDMGPPKKVAKTGSGKKSERLAKKTPGDKPSKIGGAKKRKSEDDQASTPKRKRVFAEGSSSVNPVSPPKRSRVKDFPAGNAATSASRVAFLRSLCNLPKFGALVDLVQAMPKASSIPAHYPSWVSWKSKEGHLPAEFHDSKYLKKMLSFAEDDLRDSSTLKGGKVDAPLLLLGLMFREVTRAMEVEPGAPSNYPTHLLHSPFGVKEVNQIEKLLKGVS